MLSIVTPSETERAFVGKAVGRSTVVKFGEHYFAIGAGTDDTVEFVRDTHNGDIYVLTRNRNLGYLTIGVLNEWCDTDTADYDCVVFTVSREAHATKLGYNVGSTDPVPDRLWDLQGTTIIRRYLKEGHL